MMKGTNNGMLHHTEREAYNSLIDVAQRISEIISDIENIAENKSFMGGVLAVDLMGVAESLREKIHENLIPIIGYVAVNTTPIIA